MNLYKIFFILIQSYILNVFCFIPFLIKKIFNKSKLLYASLLLFLGFMILLSSALSAGDVVDEVVAFDEEVPPSVFLRCSHTTTTTHQDS